MNFRIYILPLWMALLVLCSCNPTSPEKAVAYNDAIVDVQSQVVGYWDSFVAAADAGDSLAAAKALETSLKNARSGLQKLEEMKAFDGNSKLLDAAKALVNHYIKGLDNDFREILGAITSPNASMEQLVKANAVRDEFKVKEDQLFQNVEVAQKEMANRYNFTFQSNP